MIHALVLFCSCVFPLIDAETGEIVSAKEGGSVTLRTNLTEIQSSAVEWRRRFGSNRTRVIQIERGNLSECNIPIFRDRLQIDSQTGDLTITNVTNEHTGYYELSIDHGQRERQNIFIVTVYALLPVPVITRYSPRCSSLPSSSSSESKIVLLCSVVNVSDATLSWYKGNSLLSSISVSHLNISLPLEVEYHDKNTYSCVLNNPVSNQTKHLDTYQLCQTCSDCDYYWSQTTETVIRLVISAVVGVAAVVAVVVLVYDIRSRRIGLERKTKFTKQ